jgi:16S rRNA (uracil1498-N3)-methyltransferase
MNKKVRIYFSETIKSELMAQLKKEQSHYLKDVMRLKVGDTFSVFNSQGEWNANIQNYKKQATNIKILEKLRDKKENEQNIWLAFTPIKQHPLNFIIQKGTELGVQKFIPILSERTSVKEINIERVKKIIIESSEQSNRISVPEITKLETLKNFISNFPPKGCLVFCDINSSETNLKNIIIKKDLGPICILIGPEGDFSENERKYIIDLKQSYSISLAKNILRAETAAVAALTLVNYHLNLS